jgi:predicted enzyme related to lactoylglutathione lyase
MATITHFDIGADDMKRARTFYEQLFDWTFTEVPPPMDHYQLIATTGLDGKPGVGGGLMKRDAQGRTGITNFIGVASVDEALAKVKELGGQALSGRLTVPGFGYMAMCLDTEGNPFGLFQDDPQAQ